jgi:uncharacterized protein YukE
MLAGFNPDESAFDINQQSEGIQQTYADMKDSVTSLSVALEDIDSSKVFTPEQIAAAAGMAKAVREEAQGLTDLGVAVPEAIFAYLNAIDAQLATAERGRRLTTEQTEQINKIAKDMEAVMGPVNRLVVSLQTGTTASVEFKNAWNAAMKAVQQTVEDLGNAIDAMGRKVTAINSSIKATSIAASKVGNSSSGGMMHLAAGGFTKFASGGSAWGAGQDRILGAFQKGEFVMNKQDTAKWYPQLVTMNSGGRMAASPEGNVSVGDISISVQGGDTSEQTIRDIAHGLDRAVRRKVVRFR